MQPDSIIPDLSNPQSLDRFSYTQNNPINYSDPTGHMRVDDEFGGNGRGCSDPKYCQGGRPRSSEELARIRNEGKPCKNCHSQPGVTIGQSWTVSVPVTLSLSLDATGRTPDYYGDYPDDTNVPYFPGGNTQPNPCVGGPAAALCLVSLFEDLVPATNRPNTTNNFFLNFNVNYTDQGPVAVSDIQWTNQYSGKAVFKYLKVNDNYIYRGNAYMLTADSQPIKGIYHNNSNGIQITGMVETLINTPNGPGGWPYKLNYTIPPLK